MASTVHPGTVGLPLTKPGREGNDVKGVLGPPAVGHGIREGPQHMAELEMEPGQPWLRSRGERSAPGSGGG